MCSVCSVQSLWEKTTSGMECWEVRPWSWPSQLCQGLRTPSWKIPTWSPACWGSSSQVQEIFQDFLLTWESKHIYSYSSGKESLDEKFREESHQKFVFSTSQSQFLKFVFSTSQGQFPKFVFSTSQINFGLFFMVSCLMKSMVLFLGLKWSWHQLPKCCWNQWPLHKVFVTVGTRSRVLHLLY